MSTLPDYYQILHVQEDAPEAVIRASYRAMMQKMKMHPDLGGDSEHAALINEAFRTLSNQQKRQEYDSLRKASVENKQANHTASSGSPNQAYAEPGIEEEARGVIRNDQCPFCMTPADLLSTTVATRCTSCASPLHRIDRQILGSDHQRSIQRMPSRIEVEFLYRWPSKRRSRGVLTDFSPYGARMQANVSLPIGKTIKIVCNRIESIAIVRSYLEMPSSFTQQQYGLEFFSLKLASNQGNFVTIKA